MQQEKLLYFFYNRLKDPLLQSNIFLYINELAKNNNYDIQIITYEDKKFPLRIEEIQEINETFATQGIKWQQLKWHEGSNIFYKFIDLISGFLKVFYLANFKGYKNIISLGSIAVSFVYLFSKLININYYLYQYEPHSEYAVDNKIWDVSSKQFKLLNKYEKKAVQHCKVVSSGTNFMHTRLKNWEIKAHFLKITSVANSDLFNFSIEKRVEFRKKYKIDTSKILFIYPGKLGDLYYNAETLINTFKILSELNLPLHFLIISPNFNELKKILDHQELSFQNSVTLLEPIAYSEMPAALSAADLGIVAVPPGDSKKFISNIKVGEYLCSGLPYLICKGISEDDIVAEKYNVGVVVENFSKPELQNSFLKISELLRESKEVIAARCRQTGIEYRGFENQFINYKKALDFLFAK